jgi:hypothetical protein
VPNQSVLHGTLLPDAGSVAGNARGLILSSLNSCTVPVKNVDMPIQHHHRCRAVNTTCAASGMRAVAVTAAAAV